MNRDMAKIIRYYDNLTQIKHSRNQKRMCASKSARDTVSDQESLDSNEFIEPEEMNEFDYLLEDFKRAA